MFNFFNRQKTPEIRLDPVFPVATPAPPAPAPTPEPPKRTYVPMRKAMRMFEAAQDDRLTSDWSATLLTSDQIITRNLRTLVARSRHEIRNNDYARAFVRMCRQNIVGSKGVLLQAQVKNTDKSLDAEANAAIEKAWDDWGHRDNADVAGKRSWKRIQEMAIISAASDGEFFIRKIYGKDAGKYGFALQVIDPMRCHAEHDAFDLPNGRFIRSGIEFNQYGRPLAYYFQIDNPRDSFYSYAYGGRHYTRVPADEIIHGFRDDMINQKRGLPWMATSLYRLGHLAGFENASLIAARLGASKMGIVEWEDGFGPELGDGDDGSDLSITASPAEFQSLPTGAKLKEWNPQYPSNEFAVFNKAMLRGIAAGMGVAYNNLANDLENVNFSSIRQGAIDEREHWKSQQEWLIETLIQPVFEAWLPVALLKGHIKDEDGQSLPPYMIDRYKSVSWQPVRWQWIDPNSEVQAAVAAKNNLLQSAGQIIREQGKDPQTVYAEIAADIQEMESAGIPLEFIKAAILGNNFPATQQGVAKNEATKKNI